MYTLTKAPSKIFATARNRGPPRHLESYENREKSTFSTKSQNKNDGIEEQAAEMSNPKPTFQQRRIINNKRPTQPVSSQDSQLQENHIEMVSLLTRQWQKVQESLKKEGENHYEMYKERGDVKRSYENFTPFDLENLLANK